MYVRTYVRIFVQVHYVKCNHMQWDAMNDIFFKINNKLWFVRHREPILVHNIGIIIMYIQKYIDMILYNLRTHLLSFVFSFQRRCVTELKQKCHIISHYLILLLLELVRIISTGWNVRTNKCSLPTRSVLFQNIR